MRIWIRRLFLSVSVLLAFGFVVGASRLAWAQQAVEKRFDQLDQNKDGKVTPDELPAAEFFKQLDLDGNGEITKPEAAKALLKGALKAPGASKAGGTATSEMPTPSEPDKLFAAPVRQGPKLLIPGEPIRL